MSSLIHLNQYNNSTWYSSTQRRMWNKVENDASECHGHLVYVYHYGYQDIHHYNARNLSPQLSCSHTRCVQTVDLYLKYVN